MLTIPTDIIKAATTDGVACPVVSQWFATLRAERGISADASPADWPEDVWAAYRTLREAHEPGACGGSAASLLRSLDLPGE